MLHHSLYRALKLTFPRDVGSIVMEGRITFDVVTSSLEQSVGVKTPTDFFQYGFKRLLTLKDVY